MKKALFYLAGILTIISACSKELEQEQNDFSAREVKTYTIIANIKPDTKASVTDAGLYSWADDELIAVADGTTSSKKFSIDNEKKATGVFNYTGDDVSGDLRFAVSPSNVLSVPESSGNNATITLKKSYVYEVGRTNAIMIAGAPTIDGDDHVFEFHHATALIKFTYVNVPVGTKEFRLTTDQYISGASVTVDATTAPEIKVSDLSGGDISKSTSIVLSKAVTTKNTTMSFYVPVPAGKYKTIRAELLNVGGVVLKANNKSLAGDGLQLGKADLFIAPTISLATASATDSYTLVTDFYDMVNGQYVILAKKTSDADAYSYLISTTAKSARPAVGTQSIFNGTSNPDPTSSVTDEMLFTFTGCGTDWIIQNSEGNYLYTTSGNDKTRIGGTSDVWTIGIHPGNSNALCFQEANNSRYLGIYTGNNVWNTYTEVDHANYESGATSQIKLYYCGVLAEKTRLVAPSNVVATLNDDDDDVTNQIDVTWSDSSNSSADVDHYVVTLTPTSGASVTKSTNASQTASKSISIGGLQYSKKYTATVRAISANYADYKDSNWSTPDTDADATTGAKPAGVEDPTTITLAFDTDEYSASVNNYTTSWYTTHNTYRWNLANWNNNNKGWSTFVKAGSGKVASVATISTNASIPITVCKATLTIDAVTAANLNSLKLITASNSGFSSNVHEYSITIATGTQSVSITEGNRAKDLYYRFAADIKKSSNGCIQVSGATLTNILE